MLKKTILRLRFRCACRFVVLTRQHFRALNRRGVRFTVSWAQLKKGAAYYIPKRPCGTPVIRNF